MTIDEQIELKEWLLRLFDERHKATMHLLDEREKRWLVIFQSQERAVNKAEGTLERWQVAANEWRGAMTDRERTFVPRAEYMQAHDSLEGKVDALTKRMERAEGKGAGLTAAWAALVAAVGLAATLIAIVATVTR